MFVQQYANQRLELDKADSNEHHDDEHRSDEHRSDEHRSDKQCAGKHHYDQHSGAGSRLCVYARSTRG
ncbi:MAG: hypothetical protein ACYDH5_06085 [Acidimicrobiales bacterium]